MKARVSILAVWVALGAAMAQTPPPDPQTPQTQTPPTQAAPQKATSAQSDSKTAPAEMNTKTYKGTLVDLSCAAREASSPPAPAAADAANSADRAAPDSASNCTVTGSSTEFGLKMSDGKTVRFDLVGNQRAQEAVKNDKGWGKDISANKPIQAKVNGVLNGDKLIVSSIH